MKQTIMNGINYWKTEGGFNFMRRLLSWTPRYINVQGKVLLYKLRMHIEWVDNSVLINIQKRQQIFQHRKYKRIQDGLEYCQEKNLQYKIYNSDEITEVVSSNRFAGEKSRMFKYKCPPIYSCVFKDVWVYSISDLLVIGDVALSDMFVRDCGKGRYNISGGHIIKCKPGRWILTAYNTEWKEIEKGISLLGWASGNYYHFTIDILSRLPLIDREEKYWTYPLLVDTGIQKIPQMLKLLDNVNVKQHPIIWINEKVRVKVKELVYISKNTWMPPNFFEKAVPVPEDYLFSRHCVSNIRDIILKQKDWKDEGQYKKIYLSRKSSHNPRLINTESIEDIFSSSGYHILYPENLTFEEQVAAFFNAEIIVGPTGAAFTNIIYCRAGCSVNIITASGNELFFFSNIANFAGVSFTIIEAKMVKKGAAISQDTFELDEEKARYFIKIQDMQKEADV